MQSTKDFFNYDFLRTLFPMETCRYLIGKGTDKIRAHIKRCLSEADKDETYKFLPQTRVFASKPRNHLRRTVKLDPVSEYFLYDVIFRNKSKFRKPFHTDKKHFGYRFEDGEPIPVTSSYTGFKKALFSYNLQYDYSLSFDISSYFNGIYHHDIVSWFANLGVNSKDVDAIGKNLRESNSGRSIDCWPQGMYPAKMVGNDFLRFVEQHHGIRSEAVVRFMDDFVLYSNNPDALTEDFYFIQKLLGQKGLSVNPSKTVVGGVTAAQVDKNIDKVKTNLLAKRRKASLLAYLDDFEAALEEIQMTDKELGYLRDLLNEQHLEEEDAELILSLFRYNPEEVQPYIEQFFINFPHLAKNIWFFCKNIEDKNFIAEFILAVVENNGLQEYQLFWIAWVLQDFLLGTRHAPEIINKLYSHRNASIISKAKILEIPDKRFGLADMRDEHLDAGSSDWEAWASAVGHRGLPAVSRNHKLKYFGNSSPMNHLIKSIVTATN